MNSNAKILIKNFFDKFYKNMHPETALRYIPVVDELKKRRLITSKILEVGSGSLGITPYLKKPIDGVDIDFAGPQTDLLNKIKGTGTKLPFRKNSYDVVISVDFLEHLPKGDRQTAIDESIRVAKKLAIIVVPSGEHAQKQDKEIYFYWQKVFNNQNRFLSQHVTYGLPQTEEILVYIDRSLQKFEKAAQVKSYPLLNLKIRKLLMWTWISKSRVLYFLYLKGFLIFLPILKYANFQNCYRRLFVIEFLSPAKSSPVESSYE